ncbi:uncharacterized protein [Panulirus ornatus]|uniref:uncharacterized protein n=1 Tax=Panulirus ornatus TaxID=150431 RepID=UPI003A859CC7
MKLLVLAAAAAAVVSVCVGLPADPQPRKFIYQVGSPSVRRYPVYPDRLLEPSPDQLKMAMEAARLSTQTKEHQRFRPNMLMPEMMKPEMSQPETAMPELLQPWTLRPEVTEPETIRPMIEPETMRPMMEPETMTPMMEPETMRPMMEPETRPEVEPLTTRPELVEPDTTRPELVEPDTTRPELMIQPWTTTPEMMQPMTTRPDMMEAEGEMASAPLTDPPMSLDDFDELDPFINQSSVVAAPADSSASEDMLLTQTATERDIVTEAEETEEVEVGRWPTTLSPFDETGERHRLADSLDEMRDTFQPFADTTFDDQNLTEAIEEEEETATEFLSFTDIDAF